MYHVELQYVKTSERENYDKEKLFGFLDYKWATRKKKDGRNWTIQTKNFKNLLKLKWFKKKC